MEKISDPGFQLAAVEAGLEVNHASSVIIKGWCETANIKTIKTQLESNYRILRQVQTDISFQI